MLNNRKHKPEITSNQRKAKVRVFAAILFFGLWRLVLKQLSLPSEVLFQH
jgi:hypothetical protein